MLTISLVYDLRQANFPKHFVRHSLRIVAQLPCAANLKYHPDNCGDGHSIRDVQVAIDIVKVPPLFAYLSEKWGCIIGAASRELIGRKTSNEYFFRDFV